MEVESTTRSAKERVAGFEGREDHRIPFAPTSYNSMSLKRLVDMAVSISFSLQLWCYWCAICDFDVGNCGV